MPTARASTADLREQVAALTRELIEAREQQTATSQVLRVISRSQSELEPVFKTMLDNATRICDASYGVMFLREGKGFRTAATHNLPRAFAEERQRAAFFEPIPIDPLARLAKTKDRVHISDARTETAYKRGFAPFVAAVELGGVRTLLLTPLLRESELIGAFAIFRQEVRPFTEKQIELTDNFAAQAVIAIENVRLLNELRQRTNDLTELLEQQTATSEVLRVISGSPTDAKPVFNMIAESAWRLCEAQYCFVYRFDGQLLHFIAHHGLTPEVLEMNQRTYPLPSSRKSAAARAVLELKVVQIPDVQADPEFALGPMALVGGFGSVVGVPILREGIPVGSIALTRVQKGLLPERQIELLKTFADQAVIAIENARLFDEVQARTRDLSESLEQQTATAEVLRTISNSPGELEPVFDAMLENAVRICNAKFGNLMLLESDAFRTVALYGAPPAYAEARQREPLTRHRPETALGQVLAKKEPVQIADVQVEPAYYEDPSRTNFLKLAGARTVVAVPMLKEDELVGAVFIYRQEVQPFTDKQVGLLENFASQAVIAIENTRLLNELRESLQQQTATADVLKVISGSPGTLDPVFSTMLAKATELCEASYGTLWLHDRDGYRAVAMHGDLPPVWIEQWRSGAIYRPGPDRPMARATEGRQPIQIADMRTDPSYLQGDPLPVAGVEIAGIRTLLIVPMFKESEHVGLISIYRTEVLPFTEKQIELVKNFAAQAVIAIENARLLNELRESLQQQTATADVLKVISSSPGDLEPVFQTMLEKATLICEAKFGVMFLHENGFFRTRAMCGVPRALVEERRRNPVVRPSPGTGVGRVLRTKKTVHIADVLMEPEYLNVPEGFTKPGIVQFHGARTELAVPMLKDDELIGTIVIYRTEVRPFTDKQIELVTNFAAQAVIAIENTRLLSELRTRTNELAQSVGELQALGEVSQAVNSTLDLETVLTTIVRRAVELSRTDAGAIYVFNEQREEFRLHATHGMSETMIAAIGSQHIGLGDGNNIAMATTERKPVQVADTRDEPPSAVNDIVLREGYRSILVIPLLRPDHIVGALVVRRKTPGDFPQSTIELLQTFADQSVVAIQNARLYENVETRTRQLAQSLDDLRTTQDRLVQTQKLASLGQLTAGIAHEIKNPLNFVNNFSAVSSELVDELQDTLKNLPVENKTRKQIDDVTAMLRGNLEKVVQHGKRADAIVKNMLLHSREGSGEHRVVDINSLVEESLNLAYHGKRAEKQDFNITLERSFDPAAGEADVFPQDITRVLLNLISNGFYAAMKRKTEVGDGYEPALMASTRTLGDRVEIRVRDNGIGIPPDVQEKMFNPFFTTKPAGEGTGLGLSISHDIIVKQHGGSIEVETESGEYTEFRIILPRTAAFVAASEAQS